MAQYKYENTDYLKRKNTNDFFADMQRSIFEKNRQSTPITYKPSQEETVGGNTYYDKTNKEVNQYGRDIYYTVASGQKDKGSLSDQDKGSMYKYMLDTNRVKLDDFSLDARRKYGLDTYTKPIVIEQEKKEDNKNIFEKIGDEFNNARANYEYRDITEQYALAMNKYLLSQNQEDYKVAKDIEKRANEYVQKNPNVGQGNWLSNDLASYLPQLKGQLGKGLQEALPGAITGGLTWGGAAAVAGQAGPQVAIPEEVVTVPAAFLGGAIKGGSVGYVAGSSKYGFDTMSGYAYSELLDMGVPNDIARKVATSTGVVNSLIEGFGSILDLATLGVGKLATSLGKNTAKQAATKSVRSILANAAKAYGWNALGEFSEEATQEMVSIAGENLAYNWAKNREPNNTNLIKPDSLFSKNSFDRVMENGYGGLKLGLVLGAGNFAGRAGVETIGYKNYKNQQTNAKINTENVVNKMETILQNEAKKDNSIIDNSGFEALDIIENNIQKYVDNFKEDADYYNDKLNQIQFIREVLDERKQELKKEIPNKIETSFSIIDNVTKDDNAFMGAINDNSFETSLGMVENYISNSYDYFPELQSYYDNVLSKLADYRNKANEIIQIYTNDTNNIDNIQNNTQDVNNIQTNENIIEIPAYNEAIEQQNNIMPTNNTIEAQPMPEKAITGSQEISENIAPEMAENNTVSTENNTNNIVYGKNGIEVLNNLADDFAEVGVDIKNDAEFINGFNQLYNGGLHQDIRMENLPDVFDDDLIDDIYRAGLNDREEVNVITDKDRNKILSNKDFTEEKDGQIYNPNKQVYIFKNPNNGMWTVNSLSEEYFDTTIYRNESLDDTIKFIDELPQYYDIYTQAAEDNKRQLGQEYNEEVFKHHDKVGELADEIYREDNPQRETDDDYSFIGNTEDTKEETDVAKEEVKQDVNETKQEQKETVSETTQDEVTDTTDTKEVVETTDTKDDVNNESVENTTKEQPVDNDTQTVDNDVKEKEKATDTTVKEESKNNKNVEDIIKFNEAENKKFANMSIEKLSKESLQYKDETIHGVAFDDMNEYIGLAVGNPEEYEQVITKHSLRYGNIPKGYIDFTLASPGGADLNKTITDFTLSIVRAEKEYELFIEEQRHNNAINNINEQIEQVNNNLYGFKNNASSMQKGKIAKDLNKVESFPMTRDAYSKKVVSMTKKQFIESNLDVDSFEKGEGKSKRYGISIYENDGNIYLPISKTEYEYHQYLKNNNITIVDSKEIITNLKNDLQKEKSQNQENKKVIDEKYVALTKKAEAYKENTPTVTPKEKGDIENVQGNDRGIPKGQRETIQQAKSTREITNNDKGTTKGSNADAQQVSNANDQRTSEKETTSTRNLDSTETKRIDDNRTRERYAGQYDRGYVINSEMDFDKQSKKNRYANNVEAIKTLNTLLEENREATPQEMDILAKYTGWGGLSEVFGDNTDYAELKNILSEDDYASARATINDSFYTPINVMNSMYDIIRGIGITKSANILEPSAGVGNFLGTMPDSMRKGNVTAIEIDNISGNIAKLLYPNANVIVSGIQDVKNLPKNLDLVIGNVPFGTVKLYDKYGDKKRHLIHDYFLKKGIDSLKDGGIMAIITSTGTLDKVDAKIRKEIASKANLVAAFRLSNKTFNSTSVTSDLLIFQKKGENVNNITNAFEKVVDYNGAKINEYFINNPDHIVGELATTTNQFGELVTTVNDNGKTLADVVDLVPKNLYVEQVKNATTKEIENNNIKALEENQNFDINTLNVDDLQTGAIVNHNGVLYVKTVDNKLDAFHILRENSKTKQLEPVYIKPGTQDYKRVLGMLELSDAIDKLLYTQQNSNDKAAFESALSEANKIYDKFVKNYGFLNDSKNGRLFESDIRYATLMALEEESGVDNFSKTGILKERVINPYFVPEKASNAKDALAISLNMTGKVDLNYMEQLTGKDKDSLVEDLKDRIYKSNEDPNVYVESSEYLSGNVREKLRQAKELAKKDKSYERNVEALEKVQPVDLTAEQISIPLGSPWIGTDVVRDFLYHLYNIDNAESNTYQIEYNAYNSSWNFISQNNDGTANKVKNFYPSRDGVYFAKNNYSAGKYNAFEVLMKLLNKESLKVTEDGKVNEAETQRLQNAALKIEEEFNSWIFKDEKRRNKLVKEYNERYNSYVNRKYDGSHLDMPGSTIKLRNHQANAVSRIIQSLTTLLQHAVGTGKTYTMIGGAYELKRLGLANKPVMIVPKKKVVDFAKDWKKMYPAAKILALGQNDFNAKSRKMMSARIATNNYDCIIMSYEQFNEYGFSNEYQAKFVKKELDDLRTFLSSLKKNNESKTAINSIEKSIASREEYYKQLLDSKQESVVPFDLSGIDALFVDEAHNYKKPGYYTKLSRIAGIDGAASKRGGQLMMATNLMKERGKHVVFGTATPLTNTLGEMYSLFRYLGKDILDDYNMNSFDAWADTFGKIVNEVGYSTTGTKLETKQRFSQFVNVPELIKLYKTFTDVVTKKDANLKTPKVNTHHITIKNNPILDAMNSFIDKVKTSTSLAKEYGGNFKLYADAKNVALDLRLVFNRLLEFGILGNNSKVDDLDFANSKINTSAKTIYNIYKKSDKDKGTQLVFLSQGIPSTKKDKVYDYDLYNDLKKKLMAKGIKESEIAFIQTPKNEEQRKALYNKVRKGEVRVLIGSYMAMGEGLNVQDRVTAMHILDAPFRPADMEQMIGRGERQGNMFDEIDLYLYSTEKSFDAPMWQNLFRKMKAFAAMYSGDESVREVKDIEGDIDFNNLSVEAANNPLLFERNDVITEINKLTFQKQEYKNQIYEAQKVIERYEFKKEYNEESLEESKNILDIYEKHKDDKIVIDGKEYDTMADANTEILTIFTRNKKKYDIGKKIGVGTIYGLDIEMTIETPTKFELSVNIGKGKSNYNIYANTAGDGDKASTAILRLSNKIKGAESDIKYYTSRLADLEAQYNEAKKLENTPFKNDNRLVELKQRKMEIDNELSSVKAEEKEIKSSFNDNEVRQILYDMENEYSYYNNPNAKPGIADLTKGAEEKTGKVTDKNIVKPKDLVTEFEKAYNIPIKKGKVYGGKGVQGQISNRSGNIDIRYANDLRTISHEVGHHLDNKYGIRKLSTMLKYANGDTKKAQQIKNALMKAGEFAIGDKNADTELLMNEGIAEVMAMLFSNRDNIDQYKAAVDYVRSIVNEKDNKLFDEMYQKVYDFQSLPSDERGLGTMSIGESETVRESGYAPQSQRGKIDEILTKTFDSLRPLRNLQEDFDNAGITDSKVDNENFIGKIIKTRGVNGIAEADLYYNQVDLKGNVIGKPLQKILDNILPDKKASMKDKIQARNDFELYMVAMRAIDYEKRKLALPESYDVYAERRERLEQKYPHFKEVFNDIQKYTQNTMQLLVDSGIMSEEALNAIKENNLHYAPLARIMDSDFRTPSNSAGNSLTSSKRIIKKAVGGTEEIISPLETLVKNTIAIRKKAMQNDALKTFALAIDKGQSQGKLLGGIMEKIRPDMKRQVINKEQLGQELVRLGFIDKDKWNNLEQYDEIMETLYQMKEFYQTNFNQRDNKIIVYIDGKPVQYMVMDRPVLEAIKQMDRRSINGFIKVINKPVKLLRTMVISTFNFVVNNSLKDAPASTIQSEAGIGLKDLLKGYWSVMRQDKWYKEFISKGAGTSYIYLNDRKDIQRVLEKMVSKNFAQTFLDILRHPLDNLGDATKFSEAGARVAEYRKSKERKLSDLRAMENARKLSVDFMQSGSAPLVKDANMVSAFFNASLQGTYRFGQTIKKYPMRTLVRTLAWVTLPTMLLRMLINTDEEKEKQYEELTEQQRSTYYAIPAGDGFIFIPKPFMYGYIGSNIVEALWDNTKDSDPLLFEKLTTGLMNTFIPQFSISGIAPLIQSMNNENWYGSALDNYGDLKKRPVDRWDNKTSYVSRLLSQILDKVPILREADMISPKRLDNLARGYLATVGYDIVWRSPNTLKEMYDVLSDDDSTPLEKTGTIAKTTSDLFLINTNRYYKDGFSTYPQSRVDFNTIMDRLDKQYQSNKSNNVKDKSFEIIYDKMKKYNSEISKIDKKRKEIMSNNELSQKEKDKQLAQQYKLMANKAKLALQYYKLKTK